MLGNSSLVSSNQQGCHPDLFATVTKHTQESFQKPFADHSLAAFEQALGFCRRQGRKGFILDAGCGTGESTAALARLYPKHVVLGVDRSAVRLQRGREVFAGAEDESSGEFMVIRADLVDFWRLARSEGWKLERHYFLYPNPYPKKKHLLRRWHGHPVFPHVLALGGILECRSNWEVYLAEWCAAIGVVTGVTVDYERFVPESCLSPFESKYMASGHALYRAVVDLG